MKACRACGRRVSFGRSIRLWRTTCHHLLLFLCSTWKDITNRINKSFKMQNVVQAGMDACDALGVQSAWFFLAIGMLAQLACNGSVLTVPPHRLLGRTSRFAHKCCARSDDSYKLEAKSKSCLRYVSPLLKQVRRSHDEMTANTKYRGLLCTVYGRIWPILSTSDMLSTRRPS